MSEAKVILLQAARSSAVHRDWCFQCWQAEEDMSWHGSSTLQMASFAVTCKIYSSSLWGEASKSGGSIWVRLGCMSRGIQRFFQHGTAGRSVKRLGAASAEKFANTSKQVRTVYSVYPTTKIFIPCDHLSDDRCHSNVHHLCTAYFRVSFF